MTNQELKDALNSLLTIRAKLTDEQLKDFMDTVVDPLPKGLPTEVLEAISSKCDDDLERLCNEEPEFVDKFLASFEEVKPIPVYSVYSYFPEAYEDDEVLVAVTKNKEKAEALVKAIEACGSKTFLDVKDEPACEKWVQELD